MTNKPTDHEIDVFVQVCREKGMRELDVFQAVLARWDQQATPKDAELQSIIDDADAGPPTDNEWLRLECGRWTPWRHEEAHDHADGCKAPAIYAAKRDWKTRLRAYMSKWGQPVVAGEPVAWAATSEDGVVEALGMNQSRRFDTPLYLAPQPVAREPLTPEQIQDLLLCGNPTDEEMRLIRIGWDAAHGIKGG